MSVIPQFHDRNSCPLCSSCDLGEHLTLDVIRIVICHTCGFIFARDILSASEMNQFYNDSYGNQRHMNGQRINATVNTRVLRSFCPDLAERSLLDLGSGYGFLLNNMRSYGTRVAGVELSQVERSFSVEQLNIPTFDSMDSLSADEQFDVVTAFEVIEHIPNPRDFIRCACEHLKVGGSLIIGTDNFASSVVKKLGRQFPKWIPHEHISFFTPKTLRLLLEMTGVLAFAGGKSFTPWELLLRQLIFCATFGSKGGLTYHYPIESTITNHLCYRFFPVRLVMNHIWFNLFHRTDLDGEMMFVHMIKTHEGSLL